MQLEPHEVKLTKWISAIERELGSKISIGSAVASGVELHGGATARIAVTAPSDVEIGSRRIAPEPHLRIRNRRDWYSFGNSPQKVILSSDSSVRFSARTPDEVMSAIRTALESTGTRKQ